jgi:hypothetical protein
MWLSSGNGFSRLVAIDRSYEIESRPGGLWFVLVLHIFLASQLVSEGARGMPSGGIWGENGPAAGALIGLRTMDNGNKQQTTATAPSHGILGIATT